jgi:Family of unknown function (DUF5317)
MLLLALLVIGVALIPLLGGQWRRLTRLHFRHSWAIVAALAVQIVIISVAPDGMPVVHRAAHIGSYLLAAWFLVANRDVPYLWLVAAGGASNLLAISANGGVMPASRGALRTAGLLHSTGGFANSTAVARPRLLFLGDKFAIPHSFPLANVFSMGDVAIVIGMLLGAHAVSKGRWGQMGTLRDRHPIRPRDANINGAASRVPAASPLGLSARRSPLVPEPLVDVATGGIRPDHVGHTDRAV